MRNFMTRMAPVAAMMIGAAGSANAAPASAASADDLIAALKQGGHVIYIRHTQTESDYADQVDAVLGDCSTQRVLSETGWQQAKGIGQAMARHEIPVADVLSSEYCRAWQTADLAFGRYQPLAALNFEPAEEYSEAQFEAMAARVMPLLVAGSGSNRVIVGHDDPFEAAVGIYPEPQGVAFVLKPLPGGGVEVLGSIAPDGWP